jgi:hypothetical protein
MRRTLTTLSPASLLAALVVLFNPAPTMAARALQPPELLAAAYKANYEAAYQSGDTTVEPAVRSRRAAQQAADDVAVERARQVQKPVRSVTADKAALKAATAALHSAPAGWESSRMTVVYKDAYNAAYDALSKETTERPDPSAQQLPENLQPLIARGAKIRADGDAAKVAAAFAVARAVANKITAEESGWDDAAKDRAAVDRSATEK